MNHIFGYTHRLSLALQDADLDLVEASREASVCLNVLEAERNDDAVWDALVDKAQEIGALYQIKPSKPRTVGRQQHRDNVAANTPSQYWRLAMYLPFLDHLINEIRQNLVDPFPGFHAQYLIPAKLGDLDDAGVTMIYDHYGGDLAYDRRQFEQVITRWRTRWQHVLLVDLPRPWYQPSTSRTRSTTRTYTGSYQLC